MAFNDFLGQQRESMRALATNGVIGLHLVSGPLVGVAIGYGLDLYFGVGPWCKLAFLFVGIGAGFLNVWRDTADLIRKLENDKAGRLTGGREPR